MELIAVLISVIGLMIYAALLIYPLSNIEPKALNDYPFVSILIAVRNESQSIESLLDSLECLGYPKDRFEVLIGDDNSEDNTLELIQKSGQHNISWFAYRDTSNSMTGKQYVLDQLLKQVKGDCILFTDGDMVLSPDWVQAMLIDNQDTQLKVGLTEVVGSSWFAKFQNLDWLLNQNFIIWLSQRGYTLTAWGNNMSITPKTLDRLKWPRINQPNIVEDVDLMHQVLDTGGIVKYCYDHKITTKAENFVGLLNQRRRWMHGVNKIPVEVKLLAVVRLLFLPATLYLMSIHLIFGLFIFIKCILLIRIFRRLSDAPNMHFWKIGLLFIDIYEILIYSITFIYFLMPFKNKWKGRYY